MHPNPAFRASDRAAMLAWAARIGFAHLFVATPDGPMVVHAPLTAAGEDRLRFHIARANRIATHLDGATALASVAGAHGYVSPNWYAVPGNQVPTWNYVAVEIEGTLARLDEATLIAQLDTLADAHEPRPGPWTRGKMATDAFAAMLRAIIGFELTITAVRGTTKLSQNKSAADRAGVAAGLGRAGNQGLAAIMAAA